MKDLWIKIFWIGNIFHFVFRDSGCYYVCVRLALRKDACVEEGAVFFGMSNMNIHTAHSTRHMNTRISHSRQTQAQEWIICFWFGSFGTNRRRAHSWDRSMVAKMLLEYEFISMQECNIANKNKSCPWRFCLHARDFVFPISFEKWHRPRYLQRFIFTREDNTNK